MRKKLWAAGLGFLCIINLFIAVWPMSVYGETDDFSGEVRLLRQEEDCYVMQITVGNSGKDFTGIVRMIFANTENDACAFDTEIVLPEGGEKQFTLKIPKEGAETLRGICRLNFLDERGNEQQSILLRNVFGSTVNGIAVGVLSDDFSSLGFLDMGGDNFYLQNNMEMPIDLIELTEDNLDSYLDGLYFMVIDQYNVSAMKEENVKKITDWVMNGGWLILGTGAYAGQTLGGFDVNFLGLEAKGETGQGFNSLAIPNPGGYYRLYQESGIDDSQIVFAELAVAPNAACDPDTSWYESSEHPGYNVHVGRGAALVLSFSLHEEALAQAEYYLIESMYREVMYNSESYNDSTAYSSLAYMGQRALGVIDHENTNVDFTGLQILIAVYVVVVGPVLYLILRKCKRSEWYWLGAPVLGLVFIAGVFFLGQGTKVHGINVYSVTVQKADSGRQETFFEVYRPGLDEYLIPLKDGYEYGGAGFNGAHYWAGSTAEYYHYLVRHGSDGLSIGMKPGESFESGYLFAAGKTDGKGKLTADGLSVSLSGSFAGTVTNDTDRDMSYFAVLSKDYIMVFSDVKAHETLDLAKAVADGRCIYQFSAQYLDDVFHNLLDFYSRSGSNRGYDRSDMAALLIGLGRAEEQLSGDRSAVLAGVVSNYEKAVVGKCSELSYGCLYDVVKLEGTENASN